MSIKDELQSAILRTRWPDGSLVDRLSASTSELLADQIIRDLGLDNQTRGAFLIERDRALLDQAAQHLRNTMDDPWGDRAAGRLDLWAIERERIPSSQETDRG